jgi:phosphoribosylglycinamide formyltransferase 1
VIGVLVSGEGSNLQALLDEGLPIVAVASNRPDARALARAEAAGVATSVFALDQYVSREARDATMAEWLRARGAQWVVLAGYMHLLRSDFLERFPGRVINVHPALLPQFPGDRAIEEALAAGVPETGATVHFVDTGVDTGAVIQQIPVPIVDGDTVETLRARIQAVEHKLLPQVVRDLCVP